MLSVGFVLGMHLSLYIYTHTYVCVHEHNINITHKTHVQVPQLFQREGEEGKDQRVGAADPALVRDGPREELEGAGRLEAHVLDLCGLRLCLCFGWRRDEIMMGHALVTYVHINT